MLSPIHTKIIEAVTAAPKNALTSGLTRAFERHESSLQHISAAFQRFTSEPWGPEATRTFVHSWSLTNHSAACVSGIANRISLELRANRPDVDRGRLVDALVSLHRISDEDLGVGGGILHADLFYQMAELLCGDDAWMSRRYATPAAAAFRTYKHHMGLKHPDIVHALLSTVVHEVYTHGEVELILPMFREMVARRFAIEERQARRRLAWISVHCGGTERDHFLHAVDATGHYAAAHGIELEDYDLTGIFGEYIEKKAAVMRGLLDIPAQGEPLRASAGDI